MTTPNEIVVGLVSRLDANVREAYEERAGIMEFDAKQPRALAEALALLDTLRRYPYALTGVTVLQVELDGERLWVLATDLDYVRKRLADIGATETGTGDLAETVKDQFGGTAVLTQLG